MTEFNAWKNMALGSTFRCMCNYGFSFEVYVSMTVFVACFDFRIFDCMHNLKQTDDSCLEDSGVTKGEWRHLPRAQHFEGVN